MAPPTGRMSRREIVGFALLAILIVAVESLVGFSYLRGTAVIERFGGTSNLVTSLANTQRETLRLQVEVDRFAISRRDFEAVVQQEQILASQLRTLRAAGADNAQVLSDIGLMDRSLAGLAVDIENLGSTDRTTFVRQEISQELGSMERHIKRVYDREEIAYFVSTSDALSVQATAQGLLLVLAVMIGGLGAVLGWVLRRRVRNQFARAYFRLEAEMTERVRAETALRHLAYHDPLTGLPNRALFLERLSTATRSGEELAVLFVDLDDFKTINDSLGHAAGDAVLAAVARRIEGCIREGDIAARIGGDEFALLLPGTGGPAVSRLVAERILVAVHRPIEVDGEQVHVNATIGIAAGVPADRDQGDATTDNLLRNADVAMYAAKIRGKNRTEVFQDEMHNEALRRLTLRGELERAIGQDELVLHYQPIVNLQTGHTTGYEALVRWHHPERGLLGPAEFIPLAEETGLIVPMGRWVLRQACRQAAAWDAMDVARNAPAMAVNLSARQVQDPQIVADVAAALIETGLPPSRLTLEITESVLVDDAEAAIRSLEALRSLGVRIAMDDFGTGFSSLNYLARFPINILKIDRSFVQAAAGSGSDAVLARTILGLGRTLGLETVAEGIEDADQLAIMRSLGCDFGQGFFFARPADAATIRALPALDLPHLRMVGSNRRRLPAPAPEPAASAEALTA